MPVNLMGIMKLTGLAYSRIRAPKCNMGANDGSWKKRTLWMVGARPRVTRRTMTRYTRDGFVNAIAYRNALEWHNIAINQCSLVR